VSVRPNEALQPTSALVSIPVAAARRRTTLSCILPAGLSARS
jgi:hypothetical protein